MRYEQRDLMLTPMKAKTNLNSIKSSTNELQKKLKETESTKQHASQPNITHECGNGCATNFQQIICDLNFMVLNHFEHFLENFFLMIFDIRNS